MRRLNKFLSEILLFEKGWNQVCSQLFPICLKPLKCMNEGMWLLDSIWWQNGGRFQTASLHPVSRSSCWRSAAGPTWMVKNSKSAEGRWWITLSSILRYRVNIISLVPFLSQTAKGIIKFYFDDSWSRWKNVRSHSICTSLEQSVKKWRMRLSWEEWSQFFVV